MDLFKNTSKNLNNFKWIFKNSKKLRKNKRQIFINFRAHIKKVTMLNLFYNEFIV